MCYTRSRIACTAVIRWFNTSLEVLLMGGGGAIFNVVWKVAPVPSVSTVFFLYGAYVRFLFYFIDLDSRFFCAVSGCRTCLCGDNTYVVCMYY